MKADALVARLEALDLQNVEFHHKQHLEVAFFYLQRDGIEEAQAAMLRTIAALARHQGHPEKFHTTMTACWIRLVAAAMWEEPGCETADDLLSCHQALLDKELPLRFYSRARLFSAKARQAVLEPDVEPLPPVAPALRRN